MKERERVSVLLGELELTQSSARGDEEGKRDDRGWSFGLTTQSTPVHQELTRGLSWEAAAVKKGIAVFFNLFSIWMKYMPTH